MITVGYLLSHWNQYFNEHGLDCIVSGVAREYQGAKPDVMGDVSVWNTPFTGSFSNISMYYSDWIPSEFELFYSALPIKYLVDINGFDERADSWCVFLYDSTVAQAKLNGMKILVDKEHCIKMVNHRTWSLGDPKWWHIVRVGGPQRYDPPTWLKRSPNSFNLREERSTRRMLKMNKKQQLEDFRDALSKAMRERPTKEERERTEKLVRDIGTLSPEDYHKRMTI
jgi:hypothetical protein